MKDYRNTKGGNRQQNMKNKVRSLYGGERETKQTSAPKANKVHQSNVCLHSSISHVGQEKTFETRGSLQSWSPVYSCLGEISMNLIVFNWFYSWILLVDFTRVQLILLVDKDCSKITHFYVLLFAEYNHFLNCKLNIIISHHARINIWMSSTTEKIFLHVAHPSPLLHEENKVIWFYREKKLGHILRAEIQSSPVSPFKNLTGKFTSFLSFDKVTPFKKNTAVANLLWKPWAHCYLL